MLGSGTLNGVQNNLFGLLRRGQFGFVQDVLNLRGSLALRLFSQHVDQLLSCLFSAQAC